MPLYVSSRLALLNPPVVASAPALGTPNFIAEAHAVSGGSGAMTVTVPSGTADGDILIASTSLNTTSTITDPSGWTFLLQTTDGSNYRLRTYWRRASSEPASYQWTFSPSTAYSGIIAAYRDCLAAGSPIDGTPTSNTAFAADATATGLTTANNNEMLVMVASTAGARNFTASTLAELFDGVPSGGVSFGYFHGLQAVAGASGNKTATMNSSATFGAQLLAIKPSGGV